MIFNYSTAITFAPDNGDALVIFRPEIRITIHGPKRSDQFRALVDTGADNTILSELIATELGISVELGRGPAARAFGGQEVTLAFADVDLALKHADANLRWTSHVYFQVGGTSEEAIILGHQGFLEFFTATFNGADCTLDLEPNSYLPQNAR